MNCLGPRITTSKLPWRLRPSDLRNTADSPSRKLPGMRWTDQWKEKNGISKTASVGNPTPSNIQVLIEKRNEPASKEISPPRTSAFSIASPKRLAHYKVNIPPPSLEQMDQFSRISVGVSDSRHCLKRNYSHGSVKQMPQITSTKFSQSYFPLRFRIPPDQGRPRSPTPIVASLSQIMSDTNSRFPDHTREYNPRPVIETKSKVDVALESFTPEIIGPQNTQYSHASTFDSHALVDCFPFPYSHSLEPFPYNPVHSQTPSAPLLGPVESSLSRKGLLSNNDSNREGHYSSGSNASRDTISQNVLSRRRACYEWNYCLECSPTKIGECERTHICEICASPEHRAMQHWHHLATAPLPEIEAQPKLSFFSSLPESPTLVDHIPIFGSVDDTFQLHSKVSNATSRNTLVPGPEWSHEAVHPGKLKIRRRLSDALLPLTDDTIDPSNATIISNGFMELCDIQHMTPPSSPSEKQVEVILPPQVRPFQRTVTASETISPNEGSNTVTASKGGLRVTAPAFEPSYAGAWIPFASATNEFSNLFKIPSRESRRIEIVAPPDKRKNGEPVDGGLIQDFMSKRPSREMKLDGRVNTNPIPSPRKTADILKKHELDKQGLWPAISSTPECRMSLVYDGLKDHAEPWYTRRKLRISGSAKDEKYWFDASNYSFPSDKPDTSVLEILDEQLDAILRQESEETITATLETIVEICSASPTSTASQSTLFEKNRDNNVFNFESPRVPLATESSSSHKSVRSQLYSTSGQWLPRDITYVSPPTSFHESQTFAIGDFPDDEPLFNASIFPHHDELGYHQGEESARPRSADSSSTAPLTPFGSPQTPASS